MFVLLFLLFLIAFRCFKSFSDAKVWVGLYFSLYTVSVQCKYGLCITHKKHLIYCIWLILIVMERSMFLSFSVKDCGVRVCLHKTRIHDMAFQIPKYERLQQRQKKKMFTPHGKPNQRNWVRSIHTLILFCLIFARKISNLFKGWTIKSSIRNYTKKQKIQTKTHFTLHFS